MFLLLSSCAAGKPLRLSLVSTAHSFTPAAVTASHMGEQVATEVSVNEEQW